MNNNIDNPLPSFASWLPDGRMKIRVDHHLINGFNTCERYFKFRHVDLWVGRGHGKALTLGSWWSRTLELFYREMSFGTLPSIDLMLKFAADAWRELECDRVLQPKDLDTFGGAPAALLMAQQYWSQYANIDFNSWKIVAAEAGFGMKDEVLIGSDEQLVVYYMGKPDLFVQELASGKVIALDHKTKDYIKSDLNNQWKPHPQTTGYIFAGQKLAEDLGLPIADRCIINIAARNAPSDKPKDGIKKPRFLRVYPSYSLSEIEEWRMNVFWKAKRLSEALRSNVWIPNESSCHVYAGCNYRGVCSVPEASRLIILNGNYNKAEPWKPYSVADEPED